MLVCICALLAQRLKFKDAFNKIIDKSILLREEHASILAQYREYAVLRAVQMFRGP